MNNENGSYCIYYIHRNNVYKSDIHKFYLPKQYIYNFFQVNFHIHNSQLWFLLGQLCNSFYTLF